MNDVADLMMRFKTEGEGEAIRALNQVDRGITEVDHSARSAKTGLGGMFQTAGGFVIGGAVNAVASNIFEIGKGILFANASAETAKMSLETVMGSADAANAKFKEIQQFAASTPFSFPELVQSTINLEAFGIKSEDWMATIGDTAAAMGKSVDQVTQAVLDAHGGQFERLTELGIRSQVEGDKVKFFYTKNGQDMVAEADKNSAAMIDSTIKGIWNDSYEGAMVKQSKTFTGQWSTLKDNINMTMMQMTGGIFEFAKSGIGILNSVFTNGFFDTFDGILGPSVSGFLKNLVDISSGIIDAFGSGKGVKELMESLPASWQPAANAIGRVSDSVGDLYRAFRNGGAKEFFSVLGKELRTVADAGLDLGKIVLRGSLHLAESIWEGAQNFGGWLVKTVKGAWNGNPADVGIMSIIGSPVLAAGLWAGGSGRIGDFGGWLADQVTKGWDRKAVIGEVIIDGTFALGSAAGDAKDSGIASSISQSVISAITASASFGKEIGGAIIDKFTSISWGTIITKDSFNVGEGLGATIHNAVVDLVKAGISKISGANFSVDDFKNAMTAVGEGIVAAAAAAPVALAAVSTAIASFIAGGLKGLVFGEDADFTGVINKIAGGIGSVATKDNFLSVGSAVTSAIWEGIKAIVSGWSWRDIIGMIGGGGSSTKTGPAPQITNWDQPGIFSGADETGAVGSQGYDGRIPDNPYVINVKADTGDAARKLADFSSGALADLGKVKTDLPQFSGIARAAFGDTSQAAGTSSNATGNALRTMASIGMQVAAQMRSVASQIVGAFQSLPAQLSGLAFNAVNSFAAALWAGVPAITAAATAIANAVDIAVRARLLISSPSRVMDEHGKNTVSPFLGHLRRGASEASGIMGAMVLPRVSAGGVRTAGASGGAGGGNVYYVFESGSFVGRGAQSEIERMVAEGSAKRVTKGVSRGRLESSYA